MNMGIVAFSLAIALALFALLGRHAMEVRKERNYQEFWGTLFWAMLLITLPTILWTTISDVSMLTKLIALGLAGAVVGATAFVWLGYKFFKDIPPAATTESKPDPDPDPPSRQKTVRISRLAETSPSVI
jgi:hypothetical protein